MDKKDSLSDERLVSLHQQKRLNAFFAIYNRYRNYGYVIIYRILEKNHLVNALHDERETILYDAIMQAINSFDEKRGSFRYFLGSILTNKTMYSIYEFKKDPLSDYVSMDANYGEDNNLRFADSITFADKEASPREMMNLDERQKKITRNYRGVHKRRIKAMVRLKESGYTYREIARRFETSEKAVRAVFYRMKRRIDIKDNCKIKK